MRLLRWQNVDFVIEKLLTHPDSILKLAMRCTVYHFFEKKLTAKFRLEPSNLFLVVAQRDKRLRTSRTQQGNFALLLWFDRLRMHGSHIRMSGLS